ncbi:N-acetylmuramoyl-L-alanine amidase [Mycoplasmatota bacterium zrk1]
MKRIFFVVSICILIIHLFIVRTHEKEMAIYIDPGHGGYDGGAVGSDGTNEALIALEVSKLLMNYFEEVGIKVYMTRDGDYDLSNQGSNKKREDIHKRVKIINESDAELFLSIHLNAIGSSKWSGAQTFYYGDNLELAKSIQNSLKNNLGTHRKAKYINNIYLLEHSNKPGVLIEIGFLSNYNELELLKTEKYQDQVAYAIYFGVIDYLSK